MSYNTDTFRNDVVNTARSLHLSYRRAKFLLDRWYSGINNEIPNSGPDAQIHDLMNRCSDLVSDYEANNKAKLNTILLQSNLNLPSE